MSEPDFWTQSAEAMELTVEGNRLIAQEVAAFARDLGIGSVVRWSVI